MKEKVQKYKTAFAAIPEPLQKQVYIRLGFTVIFLLLFVLVLSMGFDWLTVIPFIVLSLFSLYSAWHLFRSALKGEYVVIEGICVDANVTAIRKKTKSVILKTDEHTVQVMIRQRQKKIPKGVELAIYVAKKTQVFEKDGMMVLHSYIALEIKGGTEHENRRRIGKKTQGD